MPSMPNVVGLNLEETQLALQTAAVLNLDSIGYFGEWPIRVEWTPSAEAPGIIIYQNPIAAASVGVNPLITLTVTSLPIGVVYP